METETQTKPEVQTNTEIKETEWLKNEAEEVEKSSFDGERLPTLEFPENKITQFKVDFSKPFEKWIDKKSGVVKKIVPVTQDEERFVIWLNVKNPLYGEIIKRGIKGLTEFKIMRTGLKQSTRYNVVD